jgi:hypothetical protein
VTDGRNFGLVGASPLVLHLRCATATARALTETLLIVSEIAQRERFSLNKDQSIDLVANFWREFFEVTAVRHAALW